ncbi:SnoaL-like protein [Nonomuraea fuscirosea]|uniref:SnoaL-like protein n=1 Tax=Nonomuraea fuscirosea TaxID=1291556 RepID=A0A2T0NAL3_9ACTN|nr:nuclear transport factor 2 family protein [Nonomuraea fuscirosea]PRX70058.1 SnoaL-like protein [Nonomuraea fuscirosea]
MPDVTKSIAQRNAEVVRRYLRIFEDRRTTDLEGLMAEDVLIHGAGQHVRGRHHVEASILTPGLSNCRVRIDDIFAAGTGSLRPSR